MSRKFLIVTADDFGLHEAVNNAVQQAASSGILTAASLMVGAPATASAVAVAKSVPGLRVGLHLVLTDGKPVLPARLVSALVDSTGRFSKSMVSNSVLFVTSRRARSQLEAEIRAQFEVFARTGLKLDHVNTHKHFHLHPLVLDLLIRIGKEFGAFAVRVPQEPAWFSRLYGQTAGAVCLLPWLGIMRRRLRANGMRFNDQVFGVSCSGAFDRRALLSVLARLPPGTSEIYLHPAATTSRPITPSMQSYRHGDELAALLDPAVREARAASGAVCGGYGDLAGTTEEKACA